MLWRKSDTAVSVRHAAPDLASLSRICHLGRELKDIDLQHIEFATVPIEASTPDRNRLQFAPEAAALWKASTDVERERQANGLCA